MQYNLQWNLAKARLNADKHGVTFEQATDVFKDPMAITVYDEEHSIKDEDRWITLGQANGQHYLRPLHNTHDKRKMR